MTSQLLSAVGIGLLATLILDLLNAGYSRIIGLPAPDYRTVGRWSAGLLRGRLRHRTILTTPPHPAEHEIGLLVHYATGVIFVAAMLSVLPRWTDAPTPGPALLTGLITLAFPFLVMQPAMGFGVAASRTPAPWKARGRSLINHLTFGLSIYLAGVAMSQFAG